jgi:hypothetical protein
MADLPEDEAFAAPLKESINALVELPPPAVSRKAVPIKPAILANLFILFSYIKHSTVI